MGAPLKDAEDVKMETDRQHGKAGEVDLAKVGRAGGALGRVMMAPGRSQGPTGA